MQPMPIKNFNGTHFNPWAVTLRKRFEDPKRTREIEERKKKQAEQEAAARTKRQDDKGGSGPSQPHPTH